MKPTLIRKTPMQRTAKPASGKVRQKTCRTCKAKFDPRTPMQVACGTPCAIELAAKVTATQKAKAQRQERAQDKAKLKTRADYFRETQAALNKWIREVRDAGKPCISCGRHHQGQNHAGHFLSRGSHPNLALVENNLALQCMPCNVHLSGNQLQFRRGLIERIGLEAVEALEADQEPRKHTVDELQAIKADYMHRIREAKKSA